MAFHPQNNKKKNIITRSFMFCWLCILV